MAVLLDAGLKLERAPAKGPDIRIRLDSGKTCWIEATTPTPGIGDNAVFQRPPGSWAGALYKEDGLLLRYRSALEDKLKKAEGYKTACIVGAEDVCLIAISQGAILDSDLHDHETPALARAVFPIGETVLRVVPYSEQPPTVETTTRLNVPKANKQPVSTTFFLEPRTEFISGVVFARHAIWNLTWRASEALGVIHRPHATTPLPRGTIPSRCEMWVDDDGALAHRGGARCTGSTPSSLACRWEATGTGPHRATFEGRGSPWLSPQQPCLSASRLSPSLTWRLCSAVCPLRLVRASLGPRDPSRMASPGYARSP